jgi:hypothetical protein
MSADARKVCAVCPASAIYRAVYPPVIVTLEPPEPPITLDNVALDLCLPHAQLAQRNGDAKLKVMLP